MKTPIQELIDRIKQLKYSEINEQAWDAYDTVMDLAESLLEKEKEQMRLADKNGQDRNQYKYDYMYGGAEYWDNEPKPFEEYYNETFNTNDK